MHLNIPKLRVEGPIPFTRSKNPNLHNELASKVTMTCSVFRQEVTSQVTGWRVRV